MLNEKLKTKECENNKVQNLKRRFKLKFHQNVSDCIDQMHFLRQSITFQIEEDSLNKKAQRVAFILHESLLFMKRLQTKPQIK